jgi:hypothetical protein
MCMMMMGMVGGLVQAMGAMQQANMQSAQYKAQAAALKVEAQGTRNVGGYESARARERGDLAVSKIITGMAAKGLDVASGTPADVVLDSATEVQLDVSAIRTNARAKAEKLDYEAKIAKINAKEAKKAGIIGAIAPIISGIGSVYSG